MLSVHDLKVLLDKFDNDDIVEIATGGESGLCEVDGAFVERGILVLANDMELGLRGESNNPEHHTPLVWEWKE